VHRSTLYNDVRSQPFSCGSFPGYHPHQLSCRKYRGVSHGFSLQVTRRGSAKSPAEKTSPPRWASRASCGFGDGTTTVSWAWGKRRGWWDDGADGDEIGTHGQGACVLYWPWPPIWYHMAKYERLLLLLVKIDERHETWSNFGIGIYLPPKKIRPHFYHSIIHGLSY